jgi:hypothetical protein
VGAIDRIAATRKDVEVVLQKLQPKDKKAEPTKDDPNEALKDAARDLQKKLTEMEKRLWVSPDIKGIIDDRSLIAEVDAASNPVLSTFEPPSATARTYPEQTEAMARKTFADFNKLFAEDVAEFRRKVAEEKIELLSEQEGISIGDDRPLQRPGLIGGRRSSSCGVSTRIRGAAWSRPSTSSRRQRQGPSRAPGPRSGRLSAASSMRSWPSSAPAGHLPGHLPVFEEPALWNPLCCSGAGGSRDPCGPSPRQTEASAPGNRIRSHPSVLGPYSRGSLPGRLRRGGGGMAKAPSSARGLARGLLRRGKRLRGGPLAHQRKASSGGYRGDDPL